MYRNALFLIHTASISGKNECEGTRFSIVFCYLAGVGIVFELFGSRILRKLRDSDNLKRTVKPRLFGIVFLSCNEVLCVLIACLSIYAKSITFAVMFCLVSLAHGAYMVSILTTRLEIQKHFVSYKSINCSRIIMKNEVNDIRWESRGRNFGYILVLYLRDGNEIALPQIYYVGLNQLWEKFGC